MLITGLRRYKKHTKTARSYFCKKLYLYVNLNNVAFFGVVVNTPTEKSLPVT